MPAAGKNIPDKQPVKLLKKFKNFLYKMLDFFSKKRYDITVVGNTDHC